MKSVVNLALLSLVAALAGCAICQSPYDYCNAVIGCDGQPNCDFGARAGSMFHPMDGSPETVAVAPTPARPKPAAEDEPLPERDPGSLPDDDTFSAMP